MQEGERPRIRIVAWNIRAGGGLRVNGIANALQSWEPDILSLSEFRGTPPSLLLRDLLREQGLAYQICTAERHLPAANRLLLASRWPLRRIGLRRAPQEPGKWILARVVCERPFTIGAMHAPNAVSGRKYVYLDAVLDIVRAWRGGPAMLIGDTNSGRIGIDEESPAFTPREERWMTELERRGWRDAFRYVHGDKRAYSWHSPNGGNGFRIDETFVNRRLLPRLIDTHYEWALRDGSPGAMRSAITRRRSSILSVSAIVMAVLLEPQSLRATMKSTTGR